MVFVVVTIGQIVKNIIEEMKSRLVVQIVCTNRKGYGFIKKKICSLTSALLMFNCK